MVKFDINALWQAICHAFYFIAAVFTFVLNIFKKRARFPNKSYTHQAFSHSHPSPPHTSASKNTELPHHTPDNISQKSTDNSAARV